VFTVLDGITAGAVYAVARKTTVIGRNKDANVPIQDTGVSRRHARVIIDGDGNYVVEDLGSKNGTQLNDVSVRRAVLRSGDLLQLGPNVTLAFAIIDRRAEELARRTYESSIRDPLTQAFNRRYLEARLTSEVAYAIRHKSSLGVIIFDLDHFKQTNDTHGHGAGDDVLRDLSALVLRTIRAEDVFARLGGEEFVVIARGIDPAGIGLLAERLRSAIAKLEIAWEDQVLRVTISAGYASLSELGQEEDLGGALVRLADERLLLAKERGRNRVCGEGRAG
jgi:diguanylate cyclase (GGDEF)-like protein